VDQELKAYLDEGFGRIDKRFEQIDKRFEQIDKRFEQIDKRFKGIDERFKGIDERFEVVETAIRHTQILVEGLRSDLRLVAEGAIGFTESLETFQSENRRSFEDVKALLAPYHQNFDGRIQSVDHDVKNLDRRVKVLEAKADRQTQDVVDALRQKFGKTQA